MAISQALCTSFKVELLKKEHDLTNAADTIRLALYTSSATLSAATTVYGTGSEVASGGGYTTGGDALTNVTPVSSGTTAIVDFNNLVMTGSTFTTRGGLIYNDTHASNSAICVLDFGTDKSPSGQTFTVVFPAADATNAIIRII